MKPHYLYARPPRDTVGLLRTLLLSIILLALLMLVTSCGGTFALRPDGSLAYTTPEILKAPIVREK